MYETFKKSMNGLILAELLGESIFRNLQGWQVRPTYSWMLGLYHQVTYRLLYH